MHCCPSSTVICHTLNKLPFATDSTLIMKPLFSFWFNSCLDMFMILFLICSTATSGFSSISAFKNSLYFLQPFEDYHTIINADAVSSIQHVSICQKFTLVDELCSPLWPIIAKNTFCQWQTGRSQWTFEKDSWDEQSIFYPYLWRSVLKLPW